MNSYATATLSSGGNRDFNRHQVYTERSAAGDMRDIQVMLKYT